MVLAFWAPQPEPSQLVAVLSKQAEYEFDIREVGFWGELWWAWHAVNPAYRITPAMAGWRDEPRLGHERSGGADRRSGGTGREAWAVQKTSCLMRHGRMIIVTAVILTACGPSKAQKMAACELEGIRVYKDVKDNSERSGFTGNFSYVCMKAQGYRFRPDFKNCGSTDTVIEGVDETLASCYSADTWWDRLINPSP